MAAKWRAQQRRKRWTDRGLTLPPSADKDLLALAASDVPEVSSFGAALREFVQMANTFAQIAAVKRLSDQLVGLCRAGQEEQELEPDARRALSLYAELVFGENSRPLHKGLLTVFLHQFPAERVGWVQDAFYQGCQDYGAGGCKERKFALTGLATSLATLPQRSGLVRRVTEHCLKPIVLSLCRNVEDVLAHARQGGRPTPKTMEECQDSMSALYYLLQGFSGSFRCPADSQERLQGDLDEVYLASVEVILSVLQCTHLSRDCVVGAGVALCAASQIGMCPQSLAFMFASAAFRSTSVRYALLSEEHGLLFEQGHRGMLEVAIHAKRGSTLATEIGSFSDFGKLCVYRGLLTGIPRSALNAHLVRVPQETPGELASMPPVADRTWTVWTLLYDGILPALCSLCERAIDSHFKFHTITAAQMCLQQIKASITGDVTSISAVEFSQAAAKHQLSLEAYNPLPVSMIKQVLQIVWNNWEDPLTQTVKQVQIVFDLLIDVQSVHDPMKTTGALTHSLAPQAYEDLPLATLSAEMQLGHHPHSDSEEQCIKSTKSATEQFLLDLATDLLSVGGHRKGRYVPLASLSLRLGAKRLLEMSPNLLHETIFALQDDDVCCSVSSFLKSFLERLREDYWSSQGVTVGSLTFRRLWVPALLAGLVAGNTRLRNNLNIYAVPVALEIDPDALLPMLAFVLNEAKSDSSTGPESCISGMDSNEHTSSFSWNELEGAAGLPESITSEQQVAALISILKVARSAALMDGAITYCGELPCGKESTFGSLTQTSAVFLVRGQPISVPMSLLEAAVTHMEDGVRVDIAELICLSPKTASMPSPLELRLLHIALPLNMRCSSTGFRMKWISLLKKFFIRVRTAVEREKKLQFDRCKRAVNGSQSNYFPNRTGSEHLSSEELQHLAMADPEVDQNSIVVSVEDMQHLMQWLSQLVVCSLYPSAPYERKNMAMEILNALIEVWDLSDPCAKRSGRYSSSPLLDSNDFSPYNKGLLSPESTSVVFGSLVDSWDRLREGAFKVLTRFPTPLPGLDSEVEVEKVLVWVKGLVQSPRVRESDAGALALRLIFQKYVCHLGWTVEMHPEPHVVKQSRQSENNSNSEMHRIGAAIGAYIESLNNWLEWGVGEGDRNLVKACEQSFVHGVLLVLRYTMDEIDFSSTAIRMASSCIRTALERLLSLLLHVTTLALWVVSADALNIQERFGLSPDELIKDDHAGDGPKAGIHAEAAGYMEESDDEEGLAPVEQMVMVGCWLSMKEVSLLLGTITRRVPLPGSTIESADSTTDDGHGFLLEASLTGDISNDEGILLDTKQLENIGEHFLQVLLSMKHNGAIDKTRAGFTALCDRLLRSNDPRLNAMPEAWLEQLMKHTGAEGQTVDDLLRRSAGIPAAFLALFLSEPDGAPKKLLPAAMRWILNTANNFLSEAGKENDAMSAVLKRESMAGGDVGLENVEKDLPGALKSRDDGVVPAVHCFNVMRVAFHDTNLATDTSGFCAEGLIVAIRAFSSRHWEVRNSATIAFTALVHRTIGFLNAYKRESARRAITGFEFFHRYPALHPFLLEELQSATFQLEHGTGGGLNEGAGVANRLHPSLGPVLIILSRLKPSLINNDGEDWLSPSAFMPYVTRCATQRNQHVRVLASRALAPLVSKEHLCSVLVGLAGSLPEQQRKTLSFNAVHGIVLQMHILLTSNCAGIPDVEERCKTVTMVAMTLERFLWLGSVELCRCHMVVGGFLQLLDGLLEVGRTCHMLQIEACQIFYGLESSLVHLCMECLTEYKRRAEAIDDSSFTILREIAASVYFRIGLRNWLDNVEGVDGYWGNTAVSGADGTVARPPQGGSTGHSIGAFSYSMLKVQLSQALCDDKYEIRFATLKVLRKFFQHVLVNNQQLQLVHGAQRLSKLLTLVVELLQPVCLDRLDIESHPGCVRSILGVFFCWSKIYALRSVVEGTQGQDTAKDLCTDSVWGQGSSVLQLLDRLIIVYGKSRHSKTREIAVRCLGGCLGQLVLQIRHDQQEAVKFPGPTVFVTVPQSTNLSVATIANRMRNGDKDQLACSAERSRSETDLTVAPSSLLLSKSIQERIDKFLQLLIMHSQASEGVKFRRATAEAVAACGLLQEAVWVGHVLKARVLEGKNVEALEWYASSILTVWSIAIKLLEDEDQELRQNLALSVLEIIAVRGKSKGPVKPIPAQVERVVQLSFSFLTKHFGFWMGYWDYLARLMIGTDNGSDVYHCTDLVRRLFDKELDNHHEEEFFFVQLSSYHLQILLQGHGRSVISGERGLLRFLKDGGQGLFGGIDILHEAGQDTKPVVARQMEEWMRLWRQRFLLQALASARSAVQLQVNMRWLGGVTNHQDAFKGLYRSLLGLLTLAGPLGEEEEVVTGVLELTSLLKQLPLNPLISNTFLRLLTVYQGYCHTYDLSITEFRTFIGRALCDDFETLFLIL